MIGTVSPHRLGAALSAQLFASLFFVALITFHVTPPPCDQVTANMYLKHLRSEPWLAQVEAKLAVHPYVRAAESGRLTLTQRRAFVGEQYSIQMSDARSFAVLAGHVGFLPSRLAGTPVPSAVQRAPAGATIDLFQYLLEGEVYVADLLLGMSRALGLTEEQLMTWPITSQGQGYPSYWARLALSRQRAEGAAAVAVNFDAWGRMCRRLHAALAAQPTVYNASAEELAFIAYFGETVPGLDEMAISVVREAPCPRYSDLAQAVRLVQENEVAFWDAIYAATPMAPAPPPASTGT